MYAVIEVGGHQYKVAENDVVVVDRLSEAANTKIKIDRVLLVDNNGNVSVGTPVVAGATVEATVVDHVRGDKLIVFKKKRRKGYQKETGHRADLTQIRIDKVSV